jgi:pilus assembly protein CpaE
MVNPFLTPVPHPYSSETGNFGSISTGVVKVIGEAADSLSPMEEGDQASERKLESRTDPSRARPIPRVKIKAFCEDEHTAATVEKASQNRRLAKAHLTVQMGGVQAAVASYRNASTPNLIIIESLLDRTDMLAELDRLAEVCDPETKVIAIGHVNDVLLYRELLRRGVSEYVVAPVDVAQLIESISLVYTDPATGPVGQVIAFVGAKGGSGSSTVCHNTAFAIAEALKNEVVIADFDLPFGTTGLDFNQDPLQGIADALASPGRLDQVVLDRLLSRCSDYLSLFASPGTLDQPYDLDPASCDTVIDVVRENVPWIAVDVPHLWTAWAKQVVLRADYVVITASPDLANLRNATNLVDQLQKSRPSERAPLLVLNQVGVPKRPEILIKDFVHALKLEPTIVIDFDAQLFGTAANNGQMIEEVSNKSKAAEAFRKLANILTDRSEQKSERQSVLAPILSRLRLSKK